MSTIERDEYLRLTIISERGNGEMFQGQTKYFVESAIVDDLKRQLAEVTRERDEIAKRFLGVEPASGGKWGLFCDGVKPLHDTIIEACEAAHEINCEQLGRHQLNESNHLQRAIAAEIDRDHWKGLYTSECSGTFSDKQWIIHLQNDLSQVREQLSQVKAEAAAMRRDLEKMPCGHLRSSVVTSIESGSNWCGECDMQSRLSDAIQMEKHNKEQWDREKDRRVYYQNIVYAVCNLLDGHLGYMPGQGLVTGTAETPSTMVADALEKVLFRCKQLDAAEHEAAAMRTALDKARIELMWLIQQTHARPGGSVDMAHRGAIEALKTTAGRDLLDEMKRKDERIKELEENLETTKQHWAEDTRDIETIERKCRTAKAALVEHYRGKIDPAWFGEQQPTPEPVWQYRRYEVGAAWRSCDGQSIEFNDSRHGWVKSQHYPNWQACCKDPNTFPCDESGERIEKDDPPPSKCKSCGIPYTDHLGIQGTCKQLQEAMAAIHGLVQERNRLSDQLAEQAPLVAIAMELREWLRKKTFLSGGKLDWLQTGTLGAIDALLTKLRDAKGGA